MNHKQRVFYATQLKLLGICVLQTAARSHFNDRTRLAPKTTRTVPSLFVHSCMVLEMRDKTVLVSLSFLSPRRREP